MILVLAVWTFLRTLLGRRRIQRLPATPVKR